MPEETLVVDKSGGHRLSAAEKEARYDEVEPMIRAALHGESDLLSCMATVACLLHHAFPYFYWTGFYRRVAADLLRIGPYQGTMGCHEIRFGQGVCGAAARDGRTVVVDDVHAFPGHIACDSRSASEIVVPILGRDRRLIAVLDVDSTLPSAFDEIDRDRLERIVGLLRDAEAVPVVTLE